MDNYFDVVVLLPNILHVAALFGVKLVGIFGPTNEKIWFPYQYGQAVRGLNSEWPATDEVLNVINHCTAM